MLLARLIAALALTSPPLETVAEHSHFVQSGRFDEVQRFCAELPVRHPTHVRCDTFGTTPEGRPMLALVLSQDLTRNDRVVLAQGAIHAGELDGKDAGLALVRDILDGKALPGLLDKVTFVFVPVFNVDGHENAAKDNRPNQLGPETPGFRVTSQRLNLNRDYVKADAPEMRAMLSLLHTWDPLVYVDLHTTDGMDFQPDISVMVEPRLGFPASMRAAGKTFNDALMTLLRKSGHVPLDFYPSTSDETDPLSGWAYTVAPPRFSNGYWQYWRRFGILVETHALKSNAQRVQASRDALIAILDYVRDHGETLRAAATAADQESLAGQEVALAYQPSGKATVLAFPGVAYERLPSTITGGKWVKFAAQTPKTWSTPILTQVSASVTVKAPRGGYVVPPAWVPVVAPILSAHGLRVVHLDKAAPHVAREVFHATKVETAPRTTEGRTKVLLDGAWVRESGDIAAGSLFVPIAQRGAPMVMQLLEPRGPDALVAHGFMNTVFEAREYVELSILEPWAEQELTKDAQMRKDFDALVARGASPEERIDFFYRRHPAHDRQRDVYPIMRTDTSF